MAQHNIILEPQHHPKIKLRHKEILAEGNKQIYSVKNGFSIPLFKIVIEAERVNLIFISSRFVFVAWMIKVSAVFRISSAPHGFHLPTRWNRENLKC